MIDVMNCRRSLWLRWDLLHPPVASNGVARFGVPSGLLAHGGASNMMGQAEIAKTIAINTVVRCGRVKLSSGATNTQLVRMIGFIDSTVSGQNP